MTKRYLNVLTTGDIKDTVTGELIRGSGIGDLLNQLNDENEQLKKELDKLKVVNEMLSMDFSNSEHELLKENEQLKKEYQKLKHRHSLLHDVCLDAECERDSLKKDVNSLEKENEELKELIKEKCPLCGCDLAHYYKVKGKLEDLE